MGKAQQDLDQDQGEQAEQDRRTRPSPTSTRPRTSSSRRRKDAEEQLAMEQLVKMADQLKSARRAPGERSPRTTDDYEKTRNERGGQLTIAQRNGVRSLGRVQEGIKDETGELVEKLEGSPGLRADPEARRREHGRGRRAAAERSRPTKPTQRAAKSGRETVPSSSSNHSSPTSPRRGASSRTAAAGAGRGGGAASGGDGIPPAAQIKMLKSLQEEINERTEYFDELRRRKKELTPEQTAEIDRLQGDQGTLADLARDLTRPKKDDGED